MGAYARGGDIPVLDDEGILDRVEGDHFLEEGKHFIAGFTVGEVGEGRVTGPGHYRDNRDADDDG